MKRVIIIIRPNKYFKTKQALIAKGFYSSTSKEVLGRGKKRVNYVLNTENGEIDNSVYQMVAKRMFDIYVTDQDVDKLIDVVLSVNKTGNSGDGKIFILPVDNCQRIRTGETGDDAIM